MQYSQREQHGIKPQDVASMRLCIHAVGVHGHDHKHRDNLFDEQMSAPVGAVLVAVWQFDRAEGIAQLLRWL